MRARLHRVKDDGAVFTDKTLALGDEHGRGVGLDAAPTAGLAHARAAHRLGDLVGALALARGAVTGGEGRDHVGRDGRGCVQPSTESSSM